MVKYILYFFRFIFLVFAKAWRGMGSKMKGVAVFACIIVLVFLILSRYQAGKSRLAKSTIKTQSQWISEDIHDNLVSEFKEIGFSDSSDVALRLKEIIADYQKYQIQFAERLNALEKLFLDTLQTASDFAYIESELSKCKSQKAGLDEEVKSFLAKTSIYHFQCIIVAEDPGSSAKFDEKHLGNLAAEQVATELASQSPELRHYLSHMTFTVDSVLQHFHYLKQGLQQTTFHKALFQLSPVYLEAAPVLNHSADKNKAKYYYIFSRDDLKQTANFPIEFRTAIEQSINKQQLFTLNRQAEENIKKILSNLSQSGLQAEIQPVESRLAWFSHLRDSMLFAFRQDSVLKEKYKNRLMGEKRLEIVRLAHIPDNNRLSQLKENMIELAFDQFYKSIETRLFSVEFVSKKYYVEKAVPDSVRIVGFFEDVKNKKTRYNLYLAINYKLYFAEKAKEQRKTSFNIFLTVIKFILLLILIVTLVTLIYNFEQKRRIRRI